MPPSIRVALARGDGIGPEIVDGVMHIMDAAGVADHLESVEVEMGKSVFDKGDSRGMTDEAIRTVEECALLFKGPMETPKGGGGKSINVSLRKMYGAFANIRHFQSLPGVETVYSRADIPVDFYVVRENIEDTYGGIEHRLTPDVVECKRLISAPGSDQVHRAAFHLAQRLGIESVHCGHKANIMKMSDGMFLERFRTVARDYPDITVDDVIIDALCMNLVLRPQNYKMVVLPNLQGDIVSDLAAGLVGGLGFAPSANIGDRIAIFEAVHGTAPDIAGKGLANPTSLLLSGLMMLRHLGLLKSAAIIENALLATLESGVHTGDFGSKDVPSVGTMEYAKAIASNLGKVPGTRQAVHVPDSEAIDYTPSERPRTNELIRTFHQMTSTHVGCDIYIEDIMGPQELAENLQRISAHSPFELTMISNRGTQVWPTGSAYTECVDYYRVRFELRDKSRASQLGQSASIALLSTIGERFAITDFQPLRNYDGKPGYSLAQGQ